MLKKGIYLLLALFIVFLPLSDVYAENTYSLTLNSSGYLDIASSNYGDNMRLVVEKDKAKFIYSLDEEFESIPLQLGNGNYIVKFMENIKDNKYRVVSKEKISLTSPNNTSSFLGSAQPIYWDKTPRIESLSKTIVGDVKSDREKMEKIYDYIVKNIAYDDDKLSNMKCNYVPDIEEIIDSKKGVCYDYAASFAGMLRSLNIPSKLVMGYNKDIEVYHAWNEVFIDGKWEIIDTTYDSTFLNAGINVTMIKEACEYKKIKEF